MRWSWFISSLDSSNFQTMFPFSHLDYIPHENKNVHTKLLRKLKCCKVSTVNKKSWIIEAMLTVDSNLENGLIFAYFKGSDMCIVSVELKSIPCSSKVYYLPQLSMINRGVMLMSLGTCEVSRDFFVLFSPLWLVTQLHYTSRTKRCIIYATFCIVLPGNSRMLRHFFCHFVAVF